MYQHRVLFRIPNPLKPKPFAAGLLGIRNLLALHLTTNRQIKKMDKQSDGSYKFEYEHMWILNLMLGNGAGYVWGRSLFLARNLLLATAAQYRENPYPEMQWIKPWENIALKTHPKHLGRKRWQMGITQCASAVPYMDGY